MSSLYKKAVITPHALSIVLAVLGRKPPSKPGLSSHEIYRAIHGPEETDVKLSDQVVQKQPPTRRSRGYIPPVIISTPPHPEHPIKSIRFLKKFVLEELLATDRVERVHVRRGGAGLDEQGRELDSIKTAGGVKEALPPDSRLPQGLKEAWCWRLKSAMDPSTMRKASTPPIQGAVRMLRTPEEASRHIRREINEVRPRSGVFTTGSGTAGAATSSDDKSRIQSIYRRPS